MDLNGLIKATTLTMKESGVGKDVKSGKHILHVSDEEGNKTDFVFKTTEQKVPFTINDVGEVIRTVIQVIESAIQRGETVSVRGFGRLCLQYYAPRRTHDLQTGEFIDIPGRCVPRFVSGVDLKTMARLYEHSLTEGSVETRIEQEGLSDEWYERNLYTDDTYTGTEDIFERFNNEDDVVEKDLFDTAEIIDGDD